MQKLTPFVKRSFKLPFIESKRRIGRGTFIVWMMQERLHDKDSGRLKCIDDLRKESAAKKVGIDDKIISLFR
jgi:hypothetical protein